MERILAADSIPNNWYRYVKHTLEVMRVDDKNLNFSNDELIFIDTMGKVVKIKKDNIIVKI